MNSVNLSEHDEQVALMQWWALACKHFGITEQLLFAIPNGGARNAVTGAMLKSEGVRSGVPDLFLAVPCGRWCGLFIELKKRKGGVVSPAQKLMRGELDAQNYACFICKGWDEARDCITAYINLGERLKNDK